MTQSKNQILAFSEMSDEELLHALKENKIGLTLEEARKVSDILGRDPSITEAVIWGIQGSEHCSYKSSRSHLKNLPTDAPHVMIGPGEDAGVVEIAEVRCKDGVVRKFGVVMAHESHNHPSQVVPYEGAATGVGGIVRDVLCMGAKVIASGDPLRFGEIERNQTKLIAEGVFDGISGYGNPIGVPNIAGDTYFSDGFNDNCLVNVVCLGLVAEDEIIHSYVPEEAADEGYDIIILGKPTDNSGMGGASFASLELKEEDKEANKGAVQEPNPFLKRHLLESTYDLFRILKEQGELGRVSFKDHGAGGNVCSTVEQVADRGFGAEVNVEEIHVGVEGLHPSVVACSETQERFAWICHPDLTSLILEHYNEKWALPEIASNAHASVVGKVTHGNYILKYKGEVLVDAKATDITEGLKYDRPIKDPQRNFEEPEFDQPEDLSAVLKLVLSSENVASRQPIYERYDKNVQGQSVIESGQADAGLIAPFRNREDVLAETQKIGVALSVDSNPRQAKISPYWGAANAVVESMRNVAAIGATPWAATDCLNYGNPEHPEEMWELVEGIRGVGDALRGVKHKIHSDHPTPVVSGNVSLYNYSPNGSVDPSAIIGMVGRMENIDKAITLQLKAVGSRLVLIGKRKNELGASEYYHTMKYLGANVPQNDFTQAQNEIFSVIDMIDAGYLTACHDISEGGLAVSIMEMALGPNADGQIGFEISLDDVAAGNLRTDKRLFSETQGFVFEVPEENFEAAKKIADGYGIEWVELGRTINEPNVTFSEGGTDVIKSNLDHYRNAWLYGLRDKL
ncbi:MAG: phosphoribosylformylglycinamidine synthase subunit PurL [Candidatus Peregrinibacteria bacterium]|nr:phosphoribosylformylglycinamidine synthase subunit PurL [Candidatus Peregrinibacteria bacterium]